MDYTKAGVFTPGKYGEWRFDKRSYSARSSSPRKCFSKRPLRKSSPAPWAAPPARALTLCPTIRPGLYLATWSPLPQGVRTTW